MSLPNNEDLALRKIQSEGLINSGIVEMTDKNEHMLINSSEQEMAVTSALLMYHNALRNQQPNNFSLKVKAITISYFTEVLNYEQLFDGSDLIRGINPLVVGHYRAKADMNIVVNIWILNQDEIRVSGVSLEKNRMKTFVFLNQHMAIYLTAKAVRCFRHQLGTALFPFLRKIEKNEIPHRTQPVFSMPIQILIIFVCK